MRHLLCTHCGQPMGDFSGIDITRLSRTETVVLECLVTARHRFVPAEGLVGLVYGERPDGGPEGAVRVIKQMIRNLRLKLASSGWTVETRWGVGYRLARLDDTGKTGS